MIDLAALCLDDGVPMEAVAEYLDRLSHATRKDEVAQLGRKQQRGLWRKALAAPKLTMTDFVPEDVDPRQQVVHFGKNTLPLPSKHRYFEKRFCRPEDGSSRVFGYNHAPSRNLVGPGYFVGVYTEGHPHEKDSWSERGSVVIDYFQVPDGPVARGWPKVKPNTSGLQILVYHRTRDFMRRVSAHVTIGHAHKVEKSLDHYFVLVREP